MTDAWRMKNQEINMSGTLPELERRIADNMKRGFVLISEPKPITNVYVEYKYNYNTLDKREFQGKEYDLHVKWVCKMRRVPQEVEV